MTMAARKSSRRRFESSPTVRGSSGMLCHEILLTNGKHVLVREDTIDQPEARRTREHPGQPEGER